MTDSVDLGEIEIPPPFQVAVAIVSLGFVNSKYPGICGVMNSVPRYPPEFDLRFTIPTEPVFSVKRISLDGALVVILSTDESCNVYVSDQCVPSLKSAPFVTISVDSIPLIVDVIRLELSLMT